MAEPSDTTGYRVFTVLGDTPAGVAAHPRERATPPLHWLQNAIRSPWKRTAPQSGLSIRTGGAPCASPARVRGRGRERGGGRWVLWQELGNVLRNEDRLTLGRRITTKSGPFGCQLSSAVEQRFCKPSVVGSIPTAGSTSFAPKRLTCNGGALTLSLHPRRGSRFRTHSRNRPSSHPLHGPESIQQRH